MSLKGHELMSLQPKQLEQPSKSLSLRHSYYSTAHTSSIEWGEVLAYFHHVHSIRKDHRK